MPRPTLVNGWYSLDGHQLCAKQFDANSDISSTLILRDVAAFGSTPIFEDPEGITFAENDSILECDGRMLSATMIKGHWVDYSDPALWTDETAKKFSTTLYLNHGGWSGPRVEEWIGSASNPRISTKNILGVDATFKIDKKRDMVLTQGAIVSGMKHNPPTVKSFSVGINHKLKKSHTFEDPWEFWEKLGTEVDGSIVRFIVTSIERIRECSLVYAGADPNAKAYSLSSQNIDFAQLVKDQIEKISQEELAASAASQTGDRQMPISAMLSKALKDVTGIEYSEADEVKIIPALYVCKSSADSVAKLTADLSANKTELAAFQKAERDRLMHIGLEVKKNLNPDMKDWADSLSIDQLRKHVENAASFVPADITPSAKAASKPGKLIIPSLPEGLTHADVEMMSSRFGMPIADVYDKVRS